MQSPDTCPLLSRADSQRVPDQGWCVQRKFPEWVLVLVGSREVPVPSTGPPAGSADVEPTPVWPGREECARQARRLHPADRALRTPGCGPRSAEASLQTSK